MSNSYQLLHIREVWVEAYLKGDVEWLRYLEAPCFFVKQNGKLISKAEQMAYMERSRKKFPQRKPGDVARNETVTEVREQKGWASVSGSVRIKRSGEVVSQSQFFELWLNLDDRWQVASLCIEDISRHEAT